MGLALFLFQAITFNAQTTIISPTGDGGFETGATFALNGWTATTGTATQNQWVCSTGATTGFSGSNCAYVTNNTAGTPPPHTYTISPNGRVSHIYRNITIPSGETVIILNFNWIGVGEGTTTDRMRIWLVPTSFTPTYGTQISATGSAPTGNVQVGLTKFFDNIIVTFINFVP